MDDTAKNLDNILGLAYQAEVMGKRPVSIAEGLFKTQSEADSDFIPAAKARLNQLSAVNKNQCFISKSSAAFLARMLAN